MKGGCLRSDKDSCISGPDGSCELLESWTVCCSSRQPVPFLYSYRIEQVFVDRLRCCWLIYTVVPSCASVVGTQYGPWVDIYQSSLYLVQHCQPVFTSPIHQGRPTKFPDHTGYTSLEAKHLVTVQLYRLRRRNPTVLDAFAVILSIWVFHWRSSPMVTPRYLALSTASRIWPWRCMLFHVWISCLYIFL